MMQQATEDGGILLTFSIPSPISFRQLNEAAILLGLDTDRLLENPVDELTGVEVKLVQVIPFAEIVAENVDRSVLEALPPEDLREVGAQLAADFFLYAWLEHLDRLTGGMSTLLEGQVSRPATEERSPWKGAWQADRSTSTSGCKTLRLKRSSYTSVSKP